jgi:hypothetical protein
LVLVFAVVRVAVDCAFDGDVILRRKREVGGGEVGAGDGDVSTGNIAV